MDFFKPSGIGSSAISDMFGELHDSIIADALKRQELGRTRMEMIQRNPPTPPWRRRLPTKDDLEQGRQAGTAAGPEDPYIRFAVPGPGGAMGPMQDYNPVAEGTPGAAPFNAALSQAAFAGQGGIGTPGVEGQFAEGTPGGGAFSPSQTDWDKVANPFAFEAYSDPIRKALIQADLVRTQKSIADPLWEERERAKIWEGAQINIPLGIQGRLEEEAQKRAAAIIEGIKRDMPDASSDDIRREFEKRMGSMDLGMGTPGMRLPTSYGMPSSVFASGSTGRLR